MHRIHRIVVGIAVGLLLDSLIVLWSSGWALFAFYILLPPVVVGALLGALLCRNKTYLWRPRFSAIRIMAIIILWSTCAIAPIAARWAQFYLELRSIPICPHCEKDIYEIRVLAYDSLPGYRMVLRCACEPSQCIQYYRTELAKHGWSETRSDTYHGRMSFKFTKPKRRLYISDASSEEYPPNSNTLVLQRKVSIGCTTMD